MRLTKLLCCFRHERDTKRLKYIKNVPYCFQNVKLKNVRCRCYCASFYWSIIAGDLEPKYLHIRRAKSVSIKPNEYDDRSLAILFIGHNGSIFSYERTR